MRRIEINFERKFKITVSVWEPDELGRIPVEVNAEILQDMPPLQIGDQSEIADLNFIISKGVFEDETGGYFCSDLGTLMQGLIFVSEDYLVGQFVEDYNEGAWRNDSDEVVANA